MADAKRDENRVSTLIAISSVDGTTSTLIKANPATGGVIVEGAVTTSGTVTEASASAIKTAVEVIDNAISGTEMQVDIVASLPVGTNIIGSVLPNQYELAGNTVDVKKYYTSAGAATDGVIWSPAAGKRWYITDIFIQVSAVATVTLEDDLAAGDSAFWKAELAANSGWSHSFTTPLFSGEDAADLLITTTAGNVYVTVSGYEL